MVFLFFISINRSVFGEGRRGCDTTADQGKDIKNLTLRIAVLLIILSLLMMFSPKSAAETNQHDKPRDNQPTQDNQTPPPAVVKKAPSVIKGTDLKSDHGPDLAALTDYLLKTGSPLAPYSSELGHSEFWALLIGICSIEQYNCTRAPNNNYWGMMLPGGGLRSFATLPEAIAFMDAYFIKLYPRKNTVQSLRGYYCASACTNWEPTVLRVKALLESTM